MSVISQHPLPRVAWVLLLFLPLGGCGGIAVSEQESESRGLGGDAPTLDSELPPDFLATETNSRRLTSGEVVSWYEPHEAPLGESYEQWLAHYWQWFLSMPTGIHPREGGACDEGQSGEVFYLTTGHNKDAAERLCTIPQGQHIYFAFNSSLTRPTADCSGCGTSAQSLEDWEQKLPGMRSSLEGNILPNTVYFELDGEVVDFGSDYYVAASQSFFVPQTPEVDPYFDCIGPLSRAACGWNEGQARPFLSVGHAVMLRPLLPGDHVLRFGAISPDGAWITDVTYLLTVL